MMHFQNDKTFGRLRQVAPLVALLLICCSFSPAKTVPTMILKGFQTRGMDKDGKKSWDMEGEKALVTGSMHKLEQITLRLFLENGEKAVIKSPACNYNQASGLVESDSALVVRSNQMILNGIGYDILTGERKLRVRSHVHMRIKMKDRVALGLDVRGPRERKE